MRVSLNNTPSPTLQETILGGCHGSPNKTSNSKRVNRNGRNFISMPQPRRLLANSLPSVGNDDSDKGEVAHCRRGSIRLYCSLCEDYVNEFDEKHQKHSGIEKDSKAVWKLFDRKSDNETAKKFNAANIDSDKGEVAHCGRGSIRLYCSLCENYVNEFDEKHRQHSGIEKDSKAVWKLFDRKSDNETAKNFNDTMNFAYATVEKKNVIPVLIKSHCPICN